MAGFFTNDAGAGDVSFVSSADGVSWGAMESIAQGGVGATITNLSIGPNGEDYVTTSASEGFIQPGSGCTTGIYLVTSTDGRASFSGCGVDGTAPDSIVGSLLNMTSSIGTTRLAGKYVAGGLAETPPDGGQSLFDYGLMYYQSP